MSASESRNQANRLNAQKSTGPQTDEGKSRASRNATTHGYFCKDTVLPGEDPVLFEMLRQDHIRALKPRNIAELFLVDRITICSWKLNRMQATALQLHESKFDELHERAELRAQLPQQRIKSIQCYNEQIASRKFIETVKGGMTACQSATAALIDRRGDNSLDRLSMLEHRLENTIFRCHRELRAMRKDKEKFDDLPESPYLQSNMDTIDERYDTWRESRPEYLHVKFPPREVFDPPYDEEDAFEEEQLPEDSENLQNEPKEEQNEDG